MTEQNKQPAFEKVTPKMQVGVNGTVRLVVQRCNKAKLLVDNKDKWVEINKGLVLHLGFADGVTKDILTGVCKSVLKAGLSTSDKWSADHSDTNSVAELVKSGIPQDILVIPQASAVCKLEKGDKYIKYNRQADKDLSRELFWEFGREMRRVGRELITGIFETEFDFKVLFKKKCHVVDKKSLISKQNRHTLMYPNSKMFLECLTGEVYVDKNKKNKYEDKMANKGPLVSPDQFFKTGDYEGKYSTYDDRGVPLTDANGEEIAKSQKKKLEKFYAAHVKKYEKEQAAGPKEEALPDVSKVEIQEEQTPSLEEEIETERIEMVKIRYFDQKFEN